MVAGDGRPRLMSSSPRPQAQENDLTAYISTLARQRASPQPSTRSVNDLLAESRRQRPRHLDLPLSALAQQRPNGDAHGHVFGDRPPFALASPLGSGSGSRQPGLFYYHTTALSEAAKCEAAQLRSLRRTVAGPVPPGSWREDFLARALTPSSSTSSMRCSAGSVERSKGKRRSEGHGRDDALADQGSDTSDGERQRRRRLHLNRVFVDSLHSPPSHDTTPSHHCRSLVTQVLLSIISDLNSASPQLDHLVFLLPSHLKSRLLDVAASLRPLSDAGVKALLLDNGTADDTGSCGSEQALDRRAAALGGGSDVGTSTDRERGREGTEMEADETSDDWDAQDSDDGDRTSALPSVDDASDQHLETLNLAGSGVTLRTLKDVLFPRPSTKDRDRGRDRDGEWDSSTLTPWHFHLRALSLAATPDFPLFSLPTLNFLCKLSSLTRLSLAGNVSSAATSSPFPSHVRTRDPFHASAAVALSKLSRHLPNLIFLDLSYNAPWLDVEALRKGVEWGSRWKRLEVLGLRGICPSETMGGEQGGGSGGTGGTGVVDETRREKQGMRREVEDLVMGRDDLGIRRRWVEVVFD